MQKLKNLLSNMTSIMKGIVKMAIEKKNIIDIMINKTYIEEKEKNSKYQEIIKNYGEDIVGCSHALISFFLKIYNKDFKYDVNSTNETTRNKSRILLLTLSGLAVDSILLYPKVFETEIKRFGLDYTLQDKILYLGIINADYINNVVNTSYKNTTTINELYDEIKHYLDNVVIKNDIW